MAELIDLHARVEAMGQCRLYLTTVTEDLTGFPTAVKDMYPINALRNGEYTSRLYIYLYENQSSLNKIRKPHPPTIDPRPSVSSYPISCTRQYVVDRLLSPTRC